MNNIYTIAVETNDMGWTKSDKNFTNSILANKYMRKVVARKIMYLRRHKYFIKKLQIFHDTNCTDIINLIYVVCDVDNTIVMFDEFRVQTATVFWNENDFELFPIKF